MATILFPKKVDQQALDAMVEIKTAETEWSLSDIVSTSLPITNLQDDDIAKVARFLKTDRSKTWVSFDNFNDDAMDSVEVDAVAIVNHNLPAGAKWRVAVLDATEGATPFERLFPTGLVGGSTVNYTAPSVTEVNEDPDDDTDTAGHTVTSAGSATTIHYTFNAPARSPKVGADLQQFRVRAGLTSGGTTKNMTVSLYENGSPISSWSPVVINQSVSNGGNEFSFWWNASALSDPTGDGVELHITITGSSGVSGTVMAAAWYCDLQQAIPALNDVSDWLDVYPSGYDPAEYGLPRVAMYESTGLSMNTRHLFVQVWTESASHVDIGRVVVGRSILPSTYGFGHAIDTDVELNDDTEIVRTRDGQSRAVQRARYLRHQIRLPGLSRSEKNSILADLAAIGHGGELCMYVDTVSTGFYENIYGRFSGMRMRALAPDVWEATFDLEQRVSDDGT